MMQWSGNNPKVYVIVLNWNGWKDTIECIGSLKKLEYPNVHICVVDNASTNESVSKIQQEYPEIQILEMEQNRGYAAGNNAGIREALDHGADYMWILNNDTTVESDALWPLIAKMEEEKNIGMCGSLLKDYHDKEKIQAWGGGRYNKWLGITIPIASFDNEDNTKMLERSLDYIWGAAVFVSKSFVQSTGLMNEEYFLYYEEMDWSVRGQENYDLGIAPKSIVYHKLKASIDSNKKKNQKRTLQADYYQTRNRLKFTHDYFPYCLPTVYLTVIVASVKRLFRGQISRAMMIFKLLFTYNNQ